MNGLHFQIDPRSGVPVYRQMMDQVRYYVASGTLQPGDQLPSLRELALRLTVNPATVVKAYSELEHEGIVVMQRGRGAFIARRAGGMTSGDREKALCRLARQLAIEASQMGAPMNQVVRVVQTELEAVWGERAETVVPIKHTR